jgi:Tol biopolymer transport system component/DNA-binding winged helix-turn-helix (wHTH) protein
MQEIRCYTSRAEVGPVPVSVFEFGGFRLDPDRFELIRDGRSLRLERKPMELLILLAASDGRLVTRDEIAQRLWSSEVFVDTEHGINTAIRKIRQVLRDDPQEPSFIQTVPAMGYRFIAPIHSHSSHQHNETNSAEVTAPGVGKSPDVSMPTLPGTESAAQPTVPNRQNARRIAASSVAFVLLIFALAFLFLRRPLPPLQVSEYNQITHDGLAKFLVGTDGSRLYFNRSFPRDIAQTAISRDDIAPIPLPLPAPTLDDVAPDGTTLLVWSDDRGHQSLWSVQMPGGSIRRLADNATWSAAWAPDGKSAVYSTPDHDIDVVNSDGSGSRQLVSRDEHIAKTPIDDLVWSPDGSRIRLAKDGRIWEITPHGSGLHALLSGWHSSDQLCCGRWSTDGNFFFFLLADAFANPLQPEGQLWVIDERHSLFRQTPSDPIELASGPIRWATPLPSKDGNQVFARGIIRRGQLERYDAQSRQLRPWLKGISAEYVTFSPDGKSIAYVTFPQGVLWKANLDGSNPVQLTGPPFYPLNPTWSPDGTRILFFCREGRGKARSYTVASQGGTPQLLLPEDKEEQIDPNWSPDGRKVIFSWPLWTRGNTQDVVRILDLANRRVVTLSGSQGIWSPRWSPNGRFIAGMTSSGGITVFDFKTQRWSPLQKGEVDYPTWSSDSKFVYFVRSLTAQPGVYRVRVSGGMAERVVDLTGFRFTGHLGIWMGLDPKDTPMVMRDTGSDDIYALTLAQK